MPMKAILVAEIDCGCGAKKVVLLLPDLLARNVVYDSTSEVERLPSSKFGEQPGGRGKAAAIVAQIDDHLGDPLRPELGEGCAQVGFSRGADEGGRAGSRTSGRRGSSQRKLLS